MTIINPEMLKEQREENGRADVRAMRERLSLHLARIRDRVELDKDGPYDYLDVLNSVVVDAIGHSRSAIVSDLRKIADWIERNPYSRDDLP